MKKPLFLNALLLLSASLSPVMAFQAGESDGTGEAAAPAAPALTLDDLRTFTDVFSQIRNSYVEPVDDRTLLNAAINGMLSQLDPHSAYLPYDQFQNLDESSRGRFDGIGVNVDIVDRRIVVQAVISPSPADAAGINPRDIIISIDGRPVRGRNLQDAVDELRGEPGTEVTLEVMTPGAETREVKLVRTSVEIPSLGFDLVEDQYGYFKLSHFNRETASHFERTLESVEADGIELKGIILDLRDNPGGVLQPAVDLADGFLVNGVIVSTRGRNASMQLEFTADPFEWLPGIPVVVLIDRGSASASEVLAGALQDHGRALIIGERSFGKGSVQSVLPLRNGAGIKLTTARYYTPSGRSIQAEGITPDLALEPVRYVEESDDRLREADLERHLDHEGPTHAPEILEADSVMLSHLKDDYYVREALSLLKGASILSKARNAPGVGRLE